MRSPLSRVLLTVVALVAMVAGGASATAQTAAQPLARAHAHNDYEHERPLFDALAHGFTSVEADVFLQNGQLLVAHESFQTSPERTLQSLYLDPLARLVRQNSGSVYPTRADFQLLIDIKSDGPSTYRALHEVLSRYERMLTTYNRGRVTKRAVIAVVSGNRPREIMAAQTKRFAFYDGRLSDLGGSATAAFMPLISDNWFNHFTWTGVGPMPESERAKLLDIVTRAHAKGQRVRFYQTPDIAEPTGTREDLWQELLDADVDHINTDDLPGLQQFLLANQRKAASAAAGWPGEDRAPETRPSAAVVMRRIASPSFS